MKKVQKIKKSKKIRNYEDFKWKKKNYEVNKKYDEKILINVLKNFDKIGEYVVEPGRNEIKKFEIDIENNLKKENEKKEKK